MSKYYPYLENTITKIGKAKKLSALINRVMFLESSIIDLRKVSMVSFFFFFFTKYLSVENFRKWVKGFLSGHVGGNAM